MMRQLVKLGFSKAQLLAFVGVFAIIGGFLLLQSHAATIWYISPTGSGTACSQAQPCASFDQAYQNASGGDTVQTAAGTYPYQVISSAKAGISSPITFQPCSGCSVTVQGLDIASPWVTISNMTSYPGDNHEDTSGHAALGVLVSGANVTLNNFIAKGAYVWDMFYNAANITWNGGEVGTPGLVGYRDCLGTDHDNNPLQILGGSNILINAVHFHVIASNNATCTNGTNSVNGVHTETIRPDSVKGLTVQNSTFDDQVCPANIPAGHCGDSSNTIFISNNHDGSWPTNLTFQNNFFGSDQNPTFNGGIPDCTGYTWAYNTHHDTPGDECLANGTWIGNLAPRPSYYTCEGTHTKNVWQDQGTYTCGTDKVVAGTRFAFDQLGLGGIDGFHLLATSQAIDAAETSGYCATTLGAKDIDGDTRPQSSACDAGADEYVFPAGSANIFMSTTGSDTGTNCKRFASLSSAPTASTACLSATKALSLAQPGDIVQLMPGNYGSLTLSRQTGADTPKVIIRGDPGLVDQQTCVESQATFLSATPLCPHGNVLISGLVICGHGMSIQDFDTTGLSTTFYVGQNNTCPTNGGNNVTANHDIDLINSHFTYQSTLRGHDLLMSHVRIGPNEQVCNPSHSGTDGDNLEIWPDASAIPWTVPYNVTIDHSLIYDARLGDTNNVIQPHGCSWGAHTDLIQTLGYSNLTFTNNIMWGSVDATWEDGVINGTTMSGNNIFKNNFFGPSGIDGGNGHLALGSGDTACSTAHYLIENNTRIGGWLLNCPGASANNAFYSNYISLESADQTYTCGAGTYDYNIFGVGTNVTCGTNVKTCNPGFLYTPAQNNAEANFAHGWDLHLSATDTCLKGAGSPTNFALTDFDGQNRVAGSIDAGADALTVGSGTAGTVADLNTDGHVNIVDLSILLSHYGQAASAAQGDVNGDGSCTIVDLSILLSHYGT